MVPQPIKQRYHNYMGTIETGLDALSSLVESLYSDNIRLTDELNQANLEKNQLSDRVKQLEELQVKEVDPNRKTD